MSHTFSEMHASSDDFAAELKSIHEEGIGLIHKGTGQEVSDFFVKLNRAKDSVHAASNARQLDAHGANDLHDHLERLQRYLLSNSSAEKFGRECNLIDTHAFAHTIRIQLERSRTQGRAA